MSYLIPAMLAALAIAGVYRLDTVMFRRKLQPMKDRAQANNTREGWHTK